MDNPIDGPGRYIMRNGETIKLVQRDKSPHYVEGYFLYGVNSIEPDFGHLVFPMTKVEHANDIMSKVSFNLE